MDEIKPTRLLHDMGQSLWLDNITRDLLDSGTLQRYVDDLSVTGLTSNPTIFDQAFRDSTAYDAAIRAGVGKGRRGEDLFFDLAIEDLARAADIFRPTYDRTNHVDGWVSLEVSPVLAYDTGSTLLAAKDLSKRASRPNILIKIPGTPQGLAAIEQATTEGIPVNVTLLFSREQYLAAADAWMRGIENRIMAGLDPDVRSVASVFVSRWDAAASSQIPTSRRNELGIAVAAQVHQASRYLHASPRWQRALNEGARPQRVLWASTGTKDPLAPDTLYIESLATPYTVNTMPEKTLLAFADHGKFGRPLVEDFERALQTLDFHRDCGLDIDALGEKLQKDGAASFVKSWGSLMERIEAKTKV